MSEKTEYTLSGYEELAKVASEIGNGAHVLVPRGWAGKKVKVIRMDE